jgi:hypothetical protein
MAIGVILTEIHNRLLGFDSLGNLALNTSGITSGNTGQTPYLIGKNIPSQIAISAAKGASANICNVTFQVQDCFGNNLSGNFTFDALLSDSSTGFGLTATTPSGGIAAASSGGAILGVDTTSKAVLAQTNSSGAFILAITDTSKTGFYPVASGFNQFPAFVGAQLVSANYD